MMGSSPRTEVCACDGSAEIDKNNQRVEVRLKDWGNSATFIAAAVLTC